MLPATFALKLGPEAGVTVARLGRAAHSSIANENREV